MIREVVDLFRSKDPVNHPLPFNGVLNSSGQIIEMRIENDPKDPWWSEYHPVALANQAKVVGVVSKIKHIEAQECYEIPNTLYDGDGNCWVSIKDGKIVSLIYMRLPKNADFSAFRQNAISELKQTGAVINGTVTGKQFYPREARKLKK